VHYRNYQGISQSEGEASADKRMEELLAGALPLMPEYVPQ